MLDMDVLRLCDLKQGLTKYTAEQQRIQIEIIDPEGNASKFSEHGAFYENDQLVGLFGEQPQWVVVNFTGPVEDVKDGNYPIVPLADWEPGKVVIGLLFEDVMMINWYGALTFHRNKNKRLIAKFSCSSANWKIKDAEIEIKYVPAP
ncbi:hypothetical protein [Pseudomonas sp. NPDC086566]|uniref:hypothetical protein n=1 Tax=Pseudomonas sp. NPDC086566 TaxID=3390647 RepID=UPI003CFBFBD1